MASYTMELRTIVEQPTQFKEGLTTKDKIEEGRKKLFDFDYPFFDESYKKVFETKFIRHFYMREIGSETEELFKFRLENWLNLHMPYYNKLFESELIDFDPMKNTEVENTHAKTADKTQTDTRNTTQSQTGTGNNSTTDSRDSNGESASDGFSRHLESDTPDSRLAITSNDGEGVIEYASGINEATNNDTTTSNATETGQSDTNSQFNQDGTQDESYTSEVNDIEDFLFNRVGKIGVQSYSKMLSEFRETFIRIEKQIFQEMNELFMLVY